MIPSSDQQLSQLKPNIAIGTIFYSSQVTVLQPFLSKHGKVVFNCLFSSSWLCIRFDHIPIVDIDKQWLLQCWRWLEFLWWLWWVAHHSWSSPKLCLRRTMQQQQLNTSQYSIMTIVTTVCNRPTSLKAWTWTCSNSLLLLLARWWAKNFYYHFCPITAIASFELRHITLL